MTFATFTPPERTEGDSFKPSEHVNELLILRVNESKHIDSTVHKPEGGPAVIVDVCNLDGGNAVARDVLWMNGALVDGLKGYVGQKLVVKLVWRKGASGRDYIALEAADAAALARAEAHVKANGDPFAEALGTVAPASAEVPF